MPFFGEYHRESRRIRRVRVGAVAVGAGVLALAAIVRFAPAWLPPQWSGTQPLESAGLPARVESAAPSAPVQAGTSRAPSLVALRNLPPLQDTTHPGAATDRSM